MEDTDRRQLERIRAELLARIAEVTAQPRPSYELDGQRIDWGGYLQNLREMLDWCEEKLAGLARFEVQSQGCT
jgi:hypothetical protein